MKRSSAALLALLLASAHASALSSVELTPVAAVVKSDGASHRIVQFRCRKGPAGREWIDYTPPWPITGSGDRATMMIPNTDASANIRRVRTVAPLDLEDRETVLAWARDFLPHDAEGLTVDCVEQDPVKLNGEPTMELTAQYSLFGRPVRHSVFLCRRVLGGETELFVFDLQAKPACFDALHRAFRGSLYTVVGF